MLIDRCPSCFDSLYGPDRCVHRQRYLDAEEYIISRGVKIAHIDYESWAWAAGRSGKYGHDRYIEISSVAYKLYGWDVMNSILVHEFANCDLFNDGISEGLSREVNLE